MNNKIKERVNLIIEYIEQILADNMKIESNIEINREIIDGNKTLVLDIYVPIRNFERHFNLDILEENEIDFYKYFMNILIEKFMKSDFIGITKYYMIRPEFFGNSFSGIDITNISGSCLKLAFGSSKEEFIEHVNSYNTKIDNYLDLLRDNNNQKGLS
ncbi:MAG: hypothetical protein IJ068_04245 [Bacilli bacterium]|nr:hypothetical protein [Bacilli bacterium]